MQEERDRLQTLYAQHQITEQRLMEEIIAIKNGAETITHKTTSQIGPIGKKNAEGKEITKVVKISQEQVGRKDQLRIFTEALTRVRAEMRRIADSLLKANEVSNRRLDLEYLRLEASQSTTATEQGGSNFEEALRATVPEVWCEHEKRKGMTSQEICAENPACKNKKTAQLPKTAQAGYSFIGSSIASLYSRSSSFTHSTVMYGIGMCQKMW